MNVSDIDFGTVQEKLNNSPRGAFSIFVKINDQIGLKLFQNEDDRDDAHDRQYHAAPAGLGPEVYGRVYDCPVKQEYTEWEEELLFELGIDERDFNNYYNNHYLVEWRFGYLTELVEVCDGWNDAVFYDDNIKQLYNDLVEAIGWEFYDAKPSNCGIKDGRLICIDFGNC